MALSLLNFNCSLLIPEFKRAYRKINCLIKKNTIKWTTYKTLISYDYNCDILALYIYTDFINQIELLIYFDTKRRNIFIEAVKNNQ